MTKIIHGKKIHGRTIELAEDPCLAETQDLEVQVKVLAPARKWGDGIRRTAGAWADDPEWDAVIERIHRERKLERRPLPEVG